MVYHGSDIKLDPVNAVLLIRRPDLENEMGLLTVVPYLNTDEITIEMCGSDCSIHVESDARDLSSKIVLY